MHVIEIYVQRRPPSQVPEPMPRLKMPEKMDMATGASALVVTWMVSACSPTLKAVAAMPHRTQREQRA